MDIKPLDLGMVNAYLIKTSTGPFLIDTGIAMSRSKLEKALGQEGVFPKDIRLVIITHGDIDHIGNAAYLQKKYGVKIAVHEKDAALCRTGKINMTRKRRSSVLGKIFSKVLYALLLGPMMKKFPLEAFEPDMILSGGEDLKGAGFDAKVLHIPGHTMGSIGILTGDGDFFSGDTINNRKKPEAANIIENEEALASSLERIKGLAVRNVYPGHGRPFNRKELLL